MGRDQIRMTQSVLRALLQSEHPSGGGELTQEELAKRLGFHRATISRALTLLVEGGEVHPRRNYSTGSKYRVLVYALTSSGRQKAEAAPVVPLLALPAPEQSFVGRSKELAQLRGAFSRGGIVVVDGVPGVGKTSLIRRAVRLPAGPRTVVWTALQSAILPGTVWDSLLRGTGGPSSNAPPVPPGSLLPSADHSILTQSGVAGVLGRHPKGVLWVLDDVHAAPEATQAALREALADFVPGGKHTAVLITQRELPWPVPHGATSHLSLKGLSRKEAIVLTAAIGLPEERFETVYRETLGNPRYLRLSALQGLPEGASFADAVLRSLPTHQRKALVPLALSWGSLSRRSGLLAGITPDEIDALLSLSVLTEEAEGIRLPEPLAKRVAETAGWEELGQGHRFLAASTALPVAERFVHAVLGEEPGAAFQLLSRHRNAITSSANSAVYQAALRLAHLLPRGRRRAGVLLATAEIQRVTGDFVAASSFLERALELLPHDDPEAVLAASILSLTTLRAGYADQADRWASAVAGLTRGHRWAAAAALARGNVLTYKQQFESGGRLLAQAAKLARGRRQTELELMALHGLAHVLTQQAEWTQALTVVRRARALAVRIHRPDTERMLRATEANIVLWLGRPAAAGEIYGEVLRDARRAGANPHIVTGLMGLALVARERGQTQQAIRLTMEAVTVAEATQDRSILARAYGSLAAFLRMEGRVEEAKALSRRATAISREVGPSPASGTVREAWEFVRDVPPPERRELRRRIGRRLAPSERLEAHGR